MAGLHGQISDKSRAECSPSACPPSKTNSIPHTSGNLVFDLCAAFFFKGFFVRLVFFEYFLQTFPPRKCVAHYFSSLLLTCLPFQLERLLDGRICPTTDGERDEEAAHLLLDSLKVVLPLLRFQSPFDLKSYYSSPLSKSNSR